jgi:hypothetical protein
MAKNFIVTKEAAERIVEAGTENRIDLRQKIQKGKPKGKYHKSYFVLSGTVVASNADEKREYGSNVIIVQTQYTRNDDDGRIPCSAPLLRSDEELETGTGVIIARDIEGDWIVLAAQCPE